MKPRTGILLAAVTALLCGILVGRWLAPAPMDHAADSAGGDGTGAGDILYWVAPMDPDYRRDGPGKSPMGMDLVPVYADDGEAAGDALRIRPEVLNNIGARSASVTRRNLSLPFSAPGVVRPNANLVTHVHVRTEGWVEKLYANAEGDSVRKGDLLFEIYSPALVSAQEEYLQAVRAGRDALIGAGEERLRALGMLPAQVDALRDTGRPQPLYRQRATQDGVVLELNIREGMYVSPGTTIMSLADIRSVWLEAALFDEQLARVAAGDPVTFNALQTNRQARGAVVDYVHPTIDESSRTGRVRVVVDNASLALRPGQFMRVHFRGATRENALAVPGAAVIRTEGSTRVILALGDGRFRPREVELGLVTREYSEILRGLQAGDRVVTSAQFLIDSEASLEPALARMAGEDTPEEHRHSHHGGGDGT